MKKKQNNLKKINYTWAGVKRNFKSIEPDLNQVIQKAVTSSIRLLDDHFSETVMMLANRPAIRIRQMIKEADSRLDRFFSRITKLKEKNLQHQIEVSRFDDEGGSLVAPSINQ